MKVGVIGLGNVGGKLAASILRNGFELTVHELDRNTAAGLLEQGAAWADTPLELASRAEVVITCLPSPEASAAVMEGDNGVLGGLGSGDVWLEMSTTHEDEVRRLGERVTATGAFALDSPVSGGCHRAATGNISIFVGGERAAFDRALPVLQCMGRRILHTGPIGSASVLKVITNYLASVHLSALGEAWVVASKAGLDLAMTYEGIKASSGNSFVHETESQIILNGSYDINFTLDLVLKDLGLFEGVAERHGVPVEMARLVRGQFADAQQRYGERAWSPTIVKRLEDDCGVALRAPGFPAELIDDEPEEPGREVTP